MLLNKGVDINAELLAQLPSNYWGDIKIGDERVEDELSRLVEGMQEQIDIIKVARIRAALERFGPRFSARVLTESERRYVRDRPETMAGRWAAKEAVSKVLGLGVQGIGWRDIEVERLPTGQPAVRLHGRAAARTNTDGGIQTCTLHLHYHVRSRPRCD